MTNFILRGHAAVPDSMPGSAFLERHRVHGILRQALQDFPIAVLAAGAGCGKTQAAYSFLWRDGYRIIWLNLSEKDNDPAHFWDTLLISLNHAQKLMADGLRTIPFPATDALRAEYLRLCAEHADLDARYAVVFDNFQALHNDEISAFVEFCVQNLPLGSRAILCARTRPMLGGAPLLARLPYSLITAEDLAFTEDEFFALFEAQGQHLPLQTLMEFYQRSNGWPFAVGLLCAASKTRRVHRQALWQTTQREIFSYIDQSLFAPLPLPVRKGLIALSLTPSLPFSYLSALTERFGGDGAADLSDLEMFLHPLFLEFLGEKKALLSEEDRRHVLLTAANWSEDNGLPLEATAHFFAISAYSRVVDILLHPDLKHSPAVSAFFLKLVEEAPTTPETENDPHWIALRYIFLPRFLLDLHRYSDCLRAVVVAKERFDHSGEPAEPFVQFGSHMTLALLGLALGVRTHRYDFVDHLYKAQDWALRFPAEPALRPGRYLDMLPRRFVCQVGVDAPPGAFARYIQALRDGNNALMGLPLYADAFRAMALLAACECEYVRGHMQQAMALARQAIDLATTHGRRKMISHGYRFLLLATLGAGDVADLPVLLRTMETMQRNNPQFPGQHLRCDLVMGELYARLGFIERIAGWIKVRFVEEDLSLDMAESARDVRFALCFIDGRYEEALHLARREAFDHPPALLMDALNAAVATAVTQHRLKDFVAAAEALERAYEMAEPHEFIMPFVEYGDVMRGLLAEIGASHLSRIPAEWQQNVRRKAFHYAKIQRMAVHALLESFGARPSIDLTERQHDMLQDIASGLTRNEIAAKRFISVNTVKTTIQAVYTKLNAKNSVEALRIAQELQLL
ncbi:MAG: LuxR C-terminal-related transcriptional regulator [Oscillospiraceae bacterium]|nr:LuxR C-terminal-related transcriptional regulator [Oscillospiraceae bacterium]